MLSIFTCITLNKGTILLAHIAITKIKIGITNIKAAGSVNGTDYGTFTVVVREFDDTNKIFTAPSEKLTEDYVTGRFG